MNVKKCFDPIMITEEQLTDYLMEKNNIVLTDSQFKQISCSNITVLETYLNDETRIYYECEPKTGQAQKNFPIVRISGGEMDFYIPEHDLRSAIRSRPRSRWNFMTFDDSRKTGPLMSKGSLRGESRVSALHCQDKSERQLSNIVTYHVDIKTEQISEGEVQAQTKQDRQKRQSQEKQRQERQRQERQWEEDDSEEDDSEEEGEDPLLEKFIDACVNGDLETVNRLTRSPYNITGEDARANRNQALSFACIHGRLNIVDRLTQPPFNLNEDDARECNALAEASRMDHIDIVNRLAQPPYNINGENARDQVKLALAKACTSGYLSIVDRLAQPPFNLTGRDVDDALLRNNCTRRRYNIVKRFAEPPYNLRTEVQRICPESLLHGV